MLLSQLRHTIVNILDRLHVTFLLQRLLDQGVEGLLLTACGHGQGTPEQCCHKVLVQLLRILGVVEYTVNIGGTVVKGREEETGCGHADHSVSHTILKHIFHGVVA